MLELIEEIRSIEFHFRTLEADAPAFYKVVWTIYPWQKERYVRSIYKGVVDIDKLKKARKYEPEKWDLLSFGLICYVPQSVESSRNNLEEFLIEFPNGIVKP